MMKKLISVVVLSVFVLTGSLVAAGVGKGQLNAVSQHLDFVFRTLPLFEANRIGPTYAAIRGASVLVHSPNPAVRFKHPVDGQTVSNRFIFEMGLENWIFRPDKATNPLTNFADGTKELNTGHLHVWIYNYDTGQQVGFLGAGSNYVKVGINQVNTTQQTLPPGRYKAYVVLQDHDHMVPTQSTAPLLPGIDTVVFTVQ